MELPLLTERTYNDSRKRLSVLAQAMALDAVHRAQAQAQALLAGSGASPDTLRLLRSDVAESLLARDVARVVGLEDYAQLRTPAQREDILVQALTGTLFSWVASRAPRADAGRVLETVLSLYAPHSPPTLRAARTPT